MPTRISAGIGDHPCFLTFIAMIPIDYKFSSYLLMNTAVLVYLWYCIEQDNMWPDLQNQTSAFLHFYNLHSQMYVLEKFQFCIIRTFEVKVL